MSLFDQLQKNIAIQKNNPTPNVDPLKKYLPSVNNPSVNNLSGNNKGMQSGANYSPSKFFKSGGRVSSQNELEQIIALAYKILNNKK
jgi:hypothetical protein